MTEDQPTEYLRLHGILHGRNGWVTQIATNHKYPDTVLSSSRDKSVLIWKLTGDEDYGLAQKRLLGHNHFISDLTLSFDGNFALSSSWDKTLRLWDLSKCMTVRKFRGHTKDVLSVDFSPDNRQIVSGSRDRSIKMWNTLGKCMYTLDEGGHSDWVSCVRITPSSRDTRIVSSSWDKTVKVWNLAECELQATYTGHEGYLNAVTLSPDGSLCASGGRDSSVRLWDLTEDKLLWSFGHDDVINHLCFSPSRYWLAVAVGPTIKIWCLQDKKSVAELKPEMLGQTHSPQCLCMAWAVDGQILFAGYSDHKIRMWQVVTGS